MELGKIPLALLAGEYWYIEVQRLDELYELEFIKGAEKDLKEITYLENEKNYLKIMDIQGEQIENLEAWYNNKYLWLGLGILVTSMTVYLVK